MCLYGHHIEVAFRGFCMHTYTYDLNKCMCPLSTTYIYPYTSCLYIQAPTCPQDGTAEDQWWDAAAGDDEDEWSNEWWADEQATKEEPWWEKAEAPWRVEKKEEGEQWGWKETREQGEQWGWKSSQWCKEERKDVKGEWHDGTWQRGWGASWHKGPKRPWGDDDSMSTAASLCCMHAYIHVCVCGRVHVMCTPQQYMVLCIDRPVHVPI